MSSRGSSNDREDRTTGEIGKLVNQQLTDREALRILRGKYDPREAEKHFEKYRERLDLVTRKAHKFKNLIMEKYGTLNLKDLLKKAKKFQEKYGLNDDEFQAFVNLALNDRNYTGVNLYNQPNTPMGKLLGSADEFNLGGKMTVPVNEVEIVQEIIRLYNESRILHEQVRMQSINYYDCAPQAIQGRYDSSKHNSFSFIHPVVAALFLPKIAFFEENMLHANIGHIIQCRYNGIPIKTLPDYNLYWNLRVDPNEFVCVSPNESPLVDIKNRFVLQIELWRQVRELRESRYYSDTFGTFSMALDQCKNNLFNDAEIALVRDEGTVVRKIFGAFSLRPTLVSISSNSLSNGFMTGNYNLGPMYSRPQQIASIPIVNLRLPMNTENAIGAYSIKSALQQHHWFVENKMLVPRTTEIIHSNSVIVFYANRRYQSVNFEASMNNPPYTQYIRQLPATLNQFERLNTLSVNIDTVLSLPMGSSSDGTNQNNGQNFNLRSVVFVDKSLVDNNTIVGCSAGIVYTDQQGQQLLLKYNPAIAGLIFQKEKDKTETFGPITEFRDMDGVSAHEQFLSLARTTGTVYVYTKQ